MAENPQDAPTPELTPAQRIFPPEVLALNGLRRRQVELKREWWRKRKEAEGATTPPNECQLVDSGTSGQDPPMTNAQAKVVKQQIRTLIERGQGFTEICEILALPRRLVARHYMDVLRRYKPQKAGTDEERAAADMRLAFMQQELVEAWEVDKENEFGIEIDVEKDAAGNIISQKEKIKRSRPDKGYLAAAANIEKRRNALYGLDMPKKIEYGGGVKQEILEVVVHTRDDVEEFKREQQVFEAKFNEPKRIEGK